MNPPRAAAVLTARWKRVVAPSAIGALAVLAVSATLPPRYTALAQVLLVEPGGPGGPAGRAGEGGAREEAARRLATQVDILTSQRVGLGAVERLSPPADAAGRDPGSGDSRALLRHRQSDRLLAALDVRVDPQSNVIGIAVTDGDPAYAARAANALARSYVDLVATLGTGGGTGGTGATAGGVGTQPGALLLDAATEPRRPAWPRPARDAGLAALAGLLLGLAAALLAEARDRRIRSAADLGRAGGVAPFVTLRRADPSAGGAPEPASSAHGEPTRPMDTVASRLPARVGLPPDVGEGGTEADPPTRPLVPGQPARRSAPDVSVGAFGPGPVSPPRAGSPGAPDGRTGPAGGAARDATARDAVHRDAVHRDATVTLERPRGPADGVDAAVRQPIGQILVQSGLIHPPEVERILAWARQEGVRFGEAAVATRRVTPAQLERALARQFDYPLLLRGTTGVADEVVAAFDASLAVAADLRRLRACVRTAQQALPAGRTAARAFAVVSADRGDGRSFVAANLAVGFAQAGLRTLLVDADLRTGRLHRLFGVANGAGLTTMLSHRIGPGALQRVPGLRDLTVLPRGPEAPNPSELLSRDALGLLLDAFVRSFDAVILDTSAAGDEPDAMLVAQRAGAALLLARRHRSGEAAVASLARNGLAPGTVLLGSVLNAA